MHSETGPMPSDDISSLQKALADERARNAATSEILALISGSRDDAAPVFDAILRKAAELCGAPLAGLNIISEDRSHAVMVAHWGETRRALEQGKTVWPMNADLVPSIAMREGRIVHERDLADTEAYRSGDPVRRQVVDEEGIRTIVVVPLFSRGRTIGSIALYRREVRPFTADEIALVETFAAQAVIAIENVHQFRELQDSLEQQEATSDILRVISQSREDETQVFDLILEKAAVLCGADQGGLQLVNDARTHVRHMADWGHDRTAWRPGLEFSLDLPLSLVPTIRTGKVVHIQNYAETDAYKQRDPIAVDLVETEGVRTRLIVPLLQHGIAIGCISLSRRTVRPFTAAEIQLVETFAAQAVIAIENVRQFREVQARLAREAATREILEVISQSRDDDRPVFDVIVSRAAQLCNAPMAWLVICNDAQTLMTVAAYHGLSRRQIKTDDTFFFERDAETITGLDRAILEASTIQDEDLALTPAYLKGNRDARLLVDDEGMRTRLSIPLISGGKAIGAIILSRREVAPFATDQIALAETFAAQAVIAIENVRQFRELQTRLAREAATREILEVISQSRDDDKPVFEVVLRKAAELCHAPMASLLIVSEDRSHSVLAAEWGHHDVSGVLKVGETVGPYGFEPCAIDMHARRAGHSFA